MIEKKSKVREAIDSLVSDAIIFLKGEKKLHERLPLYTQEELDQLYCIKKDIQKYPRR